MRWAEARGLADGQWLGYQWEDPEIVPLDKCRYDVGVEVPVATRADGEVSVTEFPACRIAEIGIAGPLDLEVRALEWLYRSWLPGSGYAPAHQPGFEAWNGRPFAHGMEHFEIRIQLPGRRRRAPALSGDAEQGFFLHAPADFLPGSIRARRVPLLRPCARWSTSERRTIDAGRGPRGAQKCSRKAPCRRCSG